MFASTLIVSCFHLFGRNIMISQILVLELDATELYQKIITRKYGQLSDSTAEVNFRFDRLFLIGEHDVCS